jgi:hypothetical protein
MARFCLGLRVTAGLGGAAETINRSAVYAHGSKRKRGRHGQWAQRRPILRLGASPEALGPAWWVITQSLRSRGPGGASAFHSYIPSVPIRSRAVNRKPHVLVRPSARCAEAVERRTISKAQPEGPRRV